MMAGQLRIGRFVRVASLALVAALAVVLSACSSGSSDSSGILPLVASGREASAGGDVELCIAAGDAARNWTVSFGEKQPDGTWKLGFSQPLDVDQCRTYPSFVYAEINDAASGGDHWIAISVRSEPDRLGNVTIGCDPSTPKRWSYVNMSWFESFSTPELCSGKTVSIYRFADSRGTAEFDVNIGF